MRAFLVAVAFGLAATVQTAAAATYYVSPNGQAGASGALTNPLKTIQIALALAQPGDAVELLPGRYLDDIVTVRDGRPDAPITIHGSSKAIVSGAGDVRVIRIKNDYITLDGFTVDGHYLPDTENKNAYRDKLIYVMGGEVGNPVTGLKLTGLTIQNAGSECVRLRYHTERSEIAANVVKNCGVWDFRFLDGGKNGEGIYVGTAPEQLGKYEAPSSEPDNSGENWIHDNYFETNGNECVDIKEGSSRNVVEYNTCTGQTDPESGGMDSRGSGNIFRFNDIFGNKGAGLRIGGDASTDGVSNEIYGNKIHDNARGGIRLQRSPQSLICENTFDKNGISPITGTFGTMYAGSDPCRMTVATDTTSITGRTTTSGTSATVGAGALPQFSIKVASLSDQAVPATEPKAQNGVQPTAVSPAPSTGIVPSPDIHRNAPAVIAGLPEAITPIPQAPALGVERIPCPVARSNCIIGIYKPGVGLSVLYSTNLQLIGTTVGFADVPLDPQQLMVNPANLAGLLLGIEYDTSTSAGLAAPIIIFAIGPH